MDKQIIVLNAGENTRLAPLTTFMPKLFLSYRGKPAIFNMLLPLIKQGFKKIIFVCNENNISVTKKMMDYIFIDSNIKFEYIIQKSIVGPGNAILLCEKTIKNPTLILLSDTQSEIPNQFNMSWIGTSRIDYEEQGNWCMCKYNQRFEPTEFFDKPKQIVESDQALIGLYYFNNPKSLKKALSRINDRVDLEKETIEISDVLKEYQKFETIKILEFKKWRDLGTLENYHKNNRTQFITRCFNKIVVSDNNVVSKSTTINFEGEKAYYLNTSDKTKRIFPGLIDVNENIYSIQFFDYKNLSEYFVYYPICKMTWKYIFNELINQIEEKIWSEEADRFFNETYLKNMYLDKVKNRLEQWSFFSKLKSQNLVINGEKYESFDSLWKCYVSSIGQIIKNGNKYWSQIHGDFIFSNILYSLNHGMYVFLDPRGDFGEEMLSGDKRYDVAKLRQCYNSGYDYIINDMFDLKVDLTQGIIDYSYYTTNKELGTIFDQCLKERGFEISEVEIIEASLFLSMISLHNEAPDRQMMFFLTALKILNKRMENKNEKS